MSDWRSLVYFCIFVYARVQDFGLNNVVPFSGSFLFSNASNQAHYSPQWTRYRLSFASGSFSPFPTSTRTHYPRSIVNTGELFFSREIRQIMFTKRRGIALQKIVA